MISHYFKVAFRNHTRHKIQSHITMLSFAIAFAFVSLAVFWVYYEHTYDSFLPNYDRLYTIGTKKPESKNISNYAFFGFHSHLMENYQEVEKACGVLKGWTEDRLVEINGRAIQAGCERITPEAIDLFGIQWLEGNRKMESWNETEVAISEHIAQQLCKAESPIGQKLILRDRDGKTLKEEYRITAVFKTWPQHSNFDFHILKKLVRDPSPYKTNIYQTYIRLRPNTNAEQFLHRLKNDTIINYHGIASVYNRLIPLSEVNYTFRGGNRNLRLDDVKLFTGASILLALCALINYLTLFVSRLRNRGREMALRTICGSSTWQTGALLMVEYLLLLLGALIISMAFIELFFNEFLELSQSKVNRSMTYIGCGYLLLFIFVLSALLSLIPILYFKNKTLKVQIEFTPVLLGKNSFRIVGICMQLFISLLFIFCSTVMIKQLHYLIYADINIERKNIACIDSQLETSQLKDILKQIPSITEMVETMSPLFPCRYTTVHTFREFEGQKDIHIDSYSLFINDDVAKFYGLKIKEGPESFDLNSGEYLINETLAKQLGDPNPIGKILAINKYMKGVIRGIFYDYQYQPPTQPIRALYFTQNPESKRNHIAFKYTGDFAACQAAIEKVFQNLEVEYPDYPKYCLIDGETEYNSYLKTEFNLLKLLNILTVISVLIALFGVYSQILQECERQRKNIAIRKVYGAQVKDILMMFFKKYMLQVLIAAAFAFPIGYVLMKHWLEGYSRQTNIGSEVFLGSFIGIAILVMLCIGWHVWRAANENPATAVKKE